MKKKLIIIGAGGHFNSIINILKSDKNFKIIGLLDHDKKKKNKIKFGIKVLGNDALLKDFTKISIFLSVGLIKNFKQRDNLINKLKKFDFSFPNFKSKNSIVSGNLSQGFGNILMDHCLINNNVKIGNFNIINNKALIEHDVTIGSNVHISTGVLVNGNVKIGSNVFIGSGSIITNNRNIKSNTFIRAGSII